MRLIDADVLITYFKTLQAINSEDVLFCEDLEDIIDYIEELPTVFDIDKIVEQLEERRYNIRYNLNQKAMIQTCIEIVKGGVK